jgi:hypothetical protein
LPTRHHRVEIAGGVFTNTQPSGTAIRAIVNDKEVMNVNADGIHARPAMTDTPVAFGVERGLTTSRIDPCPVPRSPGDRATGGPRSVRPAARRSRSREAT